MKDFNEGYSWFEKNSGAYIGTAMGDHYVETVNNEIKKLVNDLNGFQNNAKGIAQLKGDLAEFWHADTFNINAAVQGSANRASVDRSTDFASVDISSNFGKAWGLKYYQDGSSSAKAQAMSVFERYRYYQEKGGADTLEQFLEKRHYTNIDECLNDPIYCGQIRIIPKDQLEDAVKWLERKIAEEASKRPEQVFRYKETLDALKTKLEDGSGNESIELSMADAEKLAKLAKQGDIDASILGLTTEELIHTQEIFRQAFKAGTTAALISMVLRVAPEVVKAIEYLVRVGEIDLDSFKRIGFEAVKGGAEGFIRGNISAAVTTSIKSGLFGTTLKNIDSSMIALATVLIMNTMKNACNVALGKMSNRQLVNTLIQDLLVSTCSIVVGNITQLILQIPIFGFLLGSFIGSIVGSFLYTGIQKAVLSFCIDTGFTMFGLVEQDYTLPEDILENIGIEVFEYENFEYQKFEFDNFEYEKFTPQQLDIDKFDIQFLRRGVIGISKIGYI